MSTKGTLYLIPSPLSDNVEVIPDQVKHTLPLIRYFLAENIRTARRFLAGLKIYDAIETLRFETLDKDTDATTVSMLMNPVMQGENAGVISEAGCPGIADPGSLVVTFAHEHGIRVVPLSGPSSMFIALMASGLNGQQFAFRGYLPVKDAEAEQMIRQYEKESAKHNQTQLFIETPYRNTLLFNRLIKVLHPQTRLCVAYDLTGASETVLTKRVAQWKKQGMTFEKKPAVFLFLADT